MTTCSTHKSRQKSDSEKLFALLIHSKSFIKMPDFGEKIWFFMVFVVNESK